MVLRHDDRLVPLGAYLGLYEGDTFRFSLPPRTRCVLTVDKLRSGTLSLELELDETLTMNGRNVPLRNRHGQVRGGVRSVYSVASEQYERAVAARPALESAT